MHKKRKSTQFYSTHKVQHIEEMNYFFSICWTGHFPALADTFLI